jgi:hypothetical protein
MANSNLDQLIDMGFEKERAEIAVKQSGGCECFVAVNILSVA